jgi:peptide-methionine (R)-S-oxide reductase
MNRFLCFPVSIPVFCLSALWCSCGNADTRIDEKSRHSAIESIFDTQHKTAMKKETLPSSEAAWKEILSVEEYRVLREKGTERPYTGVYDQHWDSGVYVCKGCGTELFSSETKFDAGCGWPSFYRGIDKSRILEKTDKSYGMLRTEVLCAYCGGHLGHVFDDGPHPTGLRYCINSVSLGFEKKK